MVSYIGIWRRLSLQFFIFLCIFGLVVCILCFLLNLQSNKCSPTFLIIFFFIFGYRQGYPAPTGVAGTPENNERITELGWNDFLLQGIFSSHCCFTRENKETKSPADKKRPLSDWWKYPGRSHPFMPSSVLDVHPESSSMGKKSKLCHLFRGTCLFFLRRPWGEGVINLNPREDKEIWGGCLFFAFVSPFFRLLISSKLSFFAKKSDDFSRFFLKTRIIFWIF